jgi:hypothetical protein
LTTRNLKPTYRDQAGFLMPMGFPTENLADGMAFEPRDGDLFICTYPKCGTTWTQYIIYQLVRRKPIAASESLRDLFPHLEETGRDQAGQQPEPRLIKTHLPLAMTPMHPGARYLVVIRNPFDCCVSFYHHTRGFPKHYAFEGGSFDSYFECFLAGAVDFGDYFDHLLPWVAAAAREHVMLLTYEELKRDTQRAVASLARFYGGTAAATAAMPGELERIIDEASLGKMQQDQQRWASQRPPDSQFVRKGVIGDWRTVFSRDQARRLAEKFDQRAAGTGAARLWPVILAAAR